MSWDWVKGVSDVLTTAGVGPVGLAFIMFMGLIVYLLWRWHQDAVSRLEREINRAAEEKRYLQNKLFPDMLKSSEGLEYSDKTKTSLSHRDNPSGIV